MQNVADMSFQIKWPAFSDEQLGQIKERLVTALNAGPAMPSNIVDRIHVEDLNMGTQPPDLEILEVSEISRTRFRGMFKLGYSGDAYVVLRTQVQVNPVKDAEPLDISLEPDILAASQPLHVPLRVRISQLRLKGIMVLVVDRRNGVTLAFKNDPLDRVLVSSSFDHLENIKNFLQETIEEKMRRVFLEQVPTIVHKVSRAYLNDFYEKQGLKGANGNGHRDVKAEFEAFMGRREQEREEQEEAESLMESDEGLFSSFFPRKPKKEPDWHSPSNDTINTSSSQDSLESEGSSTLSGRSSMEEEPREIRRRRRYEKHHIPDWKTSDGGVTDPVKLSEMELEQLRVRLMKAAGNLTDFVPGEAEVKHLREQELRRSRTTSGPRNLWNLIWGYVVKKQEYDPVEEARKQGLKLALRNDVDDGFEPYDQDLDTPPFITAGPAATGLMSDLELEPEIESPQLRPARGHRLRAIVSEAEMDEPFYSATSIAESLPMGASALSPRLNASTTQSQAAFSHPLKPSNPPLLRPASSFSSRISTHSTLTKGSSNYFTPFSSQHLPFQAGILPSPLGLQTLVSGAPSAATTAGRSRVSKPRPNLLRRHEMHRDKLWETMSAPGGRAFSILSSSAPSPRLMALNPISSAAASAMFRHFANFGTASQADSRPTTPPTASLVDTTAQSLPMPTQPGASGSLRLKPSTLPHLRPLSATSSSKNIPRLKAGRKPSDTILSPTKNKFSAHLHTLSYAYQTISPFDVEGVTHAVFRSHVPLRSRQMGRVSTSTRAHSACSTPVAATPARFSPLHSVNLPSPRGVATPVGSCDSSIPQDSTIRRTAVLKKGSESESRSHSCPPQAAKPADLKPTGKSMAPPTFMETSPQATRVTPILGHEYEALSVSPLHRPTYDHSALSSISSNSRSTSSQGSGTRRSAIARGVQTKDGYVYPPLLADPSNNTRGNIFFVGATR